jgi:hypothetical protein
MDVDHFPDHLTISGLVVTQTIGPPLANKIGFTRLVTSTPPS